MSDLVEQLIAEIQALKGRVAHLETLAPADPGVSDHGALAGLDDDDHAQYHNDARGYGRDACCGRLTLTSGTAVTTTDVTAATLYFTPFRGNQVGLYEGGAWMLHTLAELSLSLAALDAAKNHDVFLYNDAGTLKLEAVAWTNDTTRAAALALQDGIYVKSGSTSRRYLGTIRTAAAGQCEDSEARRFVWNYYQRVLRSLRAVDTTGQWTYTTAAWRASNNNTADGVGRVAFVIGVVEALVTAMACGHGWNSGGVIYAGTGIGLDATNANSAQIRNGYGNAHIHLAEFRGYPGIGYHYLQQLEYSSLETNTTYWYGNLGLANMQIGLVVTLEG